MEPEAQVIDRRNCTGCGRSTEPDHKFCPGCGRAHTATPVAGDGLLDIDAEPVTVESTVAVDRSGWLIRLAVAAGIAACGLLAFALFRQPSGEIVPDTDPEEAAEGEPDREVDEEASSTVDERSTSDSTTGTQRPDTRAGDGAGDEAGDGAVVGLGGPLVDEMTGLSVAIGSQGGRSLWVVDIDRGVVSEIEGARGDPVGAIESVVFLRRQNQVLRVDLAAPQPQPQPLNIPQGNPPGDFFEPIGVRGDHLAVVTGGLSGPDKLLFFDRDGELVGEDPGFGDNTIWWLGGVGAFDLIFDPAGGIYRQVDGEAELLSRGQLVAVGQRRVMVRECDERRDCRLLWRDRSAWTALDEPVPFTLSTSMRVDIVGDDRWLAVTDWREQPAGQLIDASTGEMVREFNDTGFSPTGLTMSADGRWLAEPSAEGRLVLVDLDNDREWPIDTTGSFRFSPGGSMSAVFVENSDS